MVTAMLPNITVLASINSMARRRSPADDGTLAGEIYNRENAKTYSVRLTMDGPQQLLVRPYVGLPLLGKTQLWRRAEAR